MIEMWVQIEDGYRQLQRRLFGDDGQGMTEYVLILALVAVALFGVINFTGLGTAMTNAVSRIVTKVDAQT